MSLPFLIRCQCTSGFSIEINSNFDSLFSIVFAILGAKGRLLLRQALARNAESLPGRGTCNT